MQVMIPSFISQHVTTWMLGVLGTLALSGALAYMDLRHVQRIEHKEAVHMGLETRLLDKIDRADGDILRLKLYNNLGSTTNAPAREQIILETEKNKRRFERELKVLQDNRPKE